MTDSNNSGDLDDKHKPKYCEACLANEHRVCRSNLRDPYFGDWCECECWASWAPGPGRQARRRVRWFPNNRRLSPPK